MRISLPEPWPKNGCRPSWTANRAKLLCAPPDSSISFPKAERSQLSGSEVVRARRQAQRPELRHSSKGRNPRD